MKTFTPLLALVLSACLGAACTPNPSGGDAGLGGGGEVGGGSGGGGGGGGGAGGGASDAGLPLTAACSTLDAARCAYLTRCGLVGEGDPEQSECLAWLQATWCGPGNWPTMVNPHVATLRYDGVAAQACADALAAQACEGFDTLPSPCASFLVPNTLLNQSCYDGYDECVQGGSTGTAVCRGAACPRTCQPLGLANEACRLDSDCRSDLFCKLTSVTVGTGLCTPRGAVGQLCASDSPCASGLKCVSGQCVDPPQSGMACLGTVCASGSYCLSTSDGGVCSLRNGLGVPCTDDVQCQSGLICQLVTGLCAPQALTMTGSACSLAQSCPAGNTCVGVTATALGQCQAPLDAGAPCVSSSDCSSYHACTNADGGIQRFCGPRQPEGGRCTEDRECQLFDLCRQSSCVALPSRGASCAVTRLCLAGPCVGFDGGYLCVDPLGAGASCAKDSDCASQRCVSGQCLPSCNP